MMGEGRMCRRMKMNKKTRLRHMHLRQQMVSCRRFRIQKMDNIYSIHIYTVGRRNVGGTSLHMQFVLYIVPSKYRRGIWYGMVW